MDYYKKQEITRRLIKVFRLSLTFLFIILAVCIVAFNIFMSVSKNPNQDSNQDFTFVDGNYVVRVNSDAWSNYYSKNTLIVVTPKTQAQISEAEFEFDKQGITEGRNVYLIKTKEEDGVSHYTVGHITFDINLKDEEKSGIYFFDAVETVGLVTNEIYVVGFLGDRLFIVLALLIAFACCGGYVYFIHTKTGEQMKFDELYAKYIKKEHGFKKYFRWQKGDYAGDKSEEDLFYEGIIINIINDTKGYKRTLKIELNDVKNAIKVINEKDFTTRSKALTYLSALNLLTAYVKSKDAILSLKHNYFFDKHVALAIKLFTENEHFEVDVFKNGNNYNLVCNGFEFNFVCQENLKGNTAEDWAGVNVFPYASYVFKEFFNKEFENYKFTNKLSSNLNDIILIIDEKLK